MTDESTYGRVARYLAGEMGTEEAATFEAELEADAQLRAELDLQRELDDMLEDREAMHVSQTLAEIGAGYAEEKKVRPLWRPWMGIAAGILLLAVVAVVLMRPEQSSPQELYTEYFQPYDVNLVVRGDDSLRNAEWNDAFEAYQNKDYQRAADRFQAIASADPAETGARFYAAMSWMAVGNVTLAIPQLEGLEKMSPHSFSTQSRWYLAMAWLNLGKPDAAKPLLEKLAGEGGKYQAPAKEILEKL